MIRGHVRTDLRCEILGGKLEEAALRFVFYLLLTGSITAARAESQLTWISWLQQGTAVISYQAPETDTVASMLSNIDNIRQPWQNSGRYDPE